MMKRWDDGMTCQICWKRAVVSLAAEVEVPYEFADRKSLNAIACA